MEAEERLVDRVRLMGKKRDTYIEKFVKGTETKRCALFPLCLEDANFCGGFQITSCSCFKERLQALPTKEELIEARRVFSLTEMGRDLFEATKTRNAAKCRMSRGKKRK